MSTLPLTLVSLITVAIIPAVVGLMSGMRRSRGLVQACLAAAVISVLWAIYWVAIANPHHVKHFILFIGLAVIALVAASFSRESAVAAA